MTLEDILRDLARPSIQVLMDGAQEAVLITDAKGVIKYTNKRFNEIVGSKEHLDKRIFLDYPFESSHQKVETLNTAIATGKERVLSYVRYGSNGDERYLNIRIVPFPGKDGARVGVIDVTNETLDGLTGALSQSYFVRMLKGREIAKALRSKSYLGLIGIDFKGLKFINDNYGNEVGDDLLRKAVELIKKSVREVDYVIRRGGDEFLVLCPETDQNRIDAINKRIQKEIEPYNLTVSDPNLRINLYLVAFASNKNYNKLFEKVSQAINAQKSLIRNGNSIIPPNP